MMESDSEFIRHVPHPECGSSDGGSLYDDGHIFCHACETLVRGKTKNPEGDNTLKAETETEDGDLQDFIEGTLIGPLKDRGLTKETLKRFGVRLSVHNNVPTRHHYPAKTAAGDLVGWKVRTMPKNFHVEGSLNKAGLFGQHLFPSGGKKVTLCEGELDAMSSFQMRGSTWPTVSINNGASAAYKECKRHFEWLNTFDEIIINFDNDEPGLKAAREVATLFPKKAKIVTMRYKDAGEYLEQGKFKEYEKDWWDAKVHQPDDILSGESMRAIINEDRAEAIFEYPWEGLTLKTFGGRASEMITVLAGTGVGKTQFLREITHNVFLTTPHNLGLIYLEETKWETGLGPMSIQLNKPLHLPSTHYTQEEKDLAFDQTWGTNRIFTLSESWKDNSIDYIVDKMTYLAKGCDCRYLVLDHISFLVSDQLGDERKMLDEIAHKLKALTVDLDVHLCIIAHARRQSGKPLEEGGTVSLSDIRGTAGIGQLSNIVLGLERNGQAEDPVERNTTTVRVVKNRFSGQTGVACRLLYDEFTGRMTEVTQEEEKE